VKNTVLIIAIFTSFFSCSKSDPVNTIPDTFTMVSIQVDDKPPTGTIYDVSLDPVVTLLFSSKIDHASVNDNILLKDKQNNIVPADYSFTNDDSTIIIQPLSSLNYLSNYSVNILANLTSQNQAKINTTNTFRFITSLDSSDKFPAITDSGFAYIGSKTNVQIFLGFRTPC
jgi:hypothetical protein